MSISPLRTITGQPVPKDDAPPADEERPSFHFKEITPEDWRANEAPLADLYTRNLISAEYVRQRLKIPEEAGQGTMAPAPVQQAKPLSDVPSGPNEKWRLKQTKNGIIAEKIGD